MVSNNYKDWNDDDHVCKVPNYNFWLKFCKIQNEM